MFEFKSSRVTASLNISHLSYLNSANLDLKPLTLIGIVPASSVQNWSSFDGNVYALKISFTKF